MGCASPGEDGRPIWTLAEVAHGRHVRPHPSCRRWWPAAHSPTDRRRSEPPSLLCRYDWAAWRRFAGTPLQAHAFGMACRVFPLPWLVMRCAGPLGEVTTPCRSTEAKLLAKMWVLASSICIAARRRTDHSDDTISEHLCAGVCTFSRELTASRSSVSLHAT